MKRVVWIVALLLLGLAAAPSLRAEDDEARAHRIGMLLRCPVCQGMPIADSPSDMAQAMMKRVRELVAEGKSQEEILAYFAERYGEWALLEPKAEGFTFLLWILPPLALLAGFVVLRAYARRLPRAAPPPQSAPPEAEETSDPYLRAVRREVDG